MVAQYAGSDDELAEILDDAWTSGAPTGVLDLSRVLAWRDAAVARALVGAEPETISTSQAAEIVGVSRATMVRFLDEGRLPYTKPGQHRRVRLADVVAFKEQVTHGAKP